MTRQSNDTGDEIATAIIKLGAIVVAAGVIAAVYLIVAICSELWRVYTTTGRAGTPVARALWWALVGFLLVVVGCVIVAVSVPGSLTGALVTSGIAAAIFFVTVEVCGHTGQEAEDGPPQVSDELDAYLNWTQDADFRGASFDADHAGARRNGR